MRIVTVYREAGAELTDQQFLTELGLLILSRDTQVIAPSGVASAGAVGTPTISFASPGATGTHPSTNDTRTVVTGPEDLSGKNFTNKVTLSGAFTGSHVSFANQPTFQGVTGNLDDVWFDYTGSSTLAFFKGATGLTLHRVSAAGFKGDSFDIDITGTLNLVQVTQRPAPAPVSSAQTIAPSAIASAAAVGTPTLSRAATLIRPTGVASTAGVGTPTISQVGAGAVTTLAAHGPTSAIAVSSSVSTPAYTIQVRADGTLKRSDTGATITINNTEFVGGTLIVESDTAGTRRTPASGALDQLRVKNGQLILRELLGTATTGQFEVVGSSSAYALIFQGCAGTFKHYRDVNHSGAGVRVTVAPSGTYPGVSSLAAGNWSAYNLADPLNPVPTPTLRLDNFTSHGASSASGPALTIDAGLNVVIGGFDPGTLSTPTGLSNRAVTIDAAVRVGGVKTDVQDVYIDKAADGTPSRLSSRTGTYRLLAGVLKRSGINNAVLPNTAGSRPEKTIWFALTNGILPGSETAANTTNDRVVAEDFVLRGAIAENLVNATFRNGAQKLQEYGARPEVFDPATPLTLWTPSDDSDNWPNGARRFIAINSQKGPLGPRPTTAATMPNGQPVANKSIIDSTWTHLGGVSGDGVLEIRDVKFDADLMVDGAGTGGKRFKSSIGTGAVHNTGGIQLVVAPNAQQAGGAAVTLDSTTGRTLKVTKPDGTAADLSAWDSSGQYGIYSGYVDSALGANAVDTGIGYRRQLSYTGIDTGAGAFTGVKLVPGPTSTPEQVIPSCEVIRVVAGVAETVEPHGLPTGDQGVITGVTGVSGTVTVTRVDDWHFSINGQSALNWDSGTGSPGVLTPTTAHPYGLAGAQSSITIPAGTTLDDTQNVNMGQPISNVILTIALGLRVRFIRCTFGDVSLQAAGSTCDIESRDCDHPVSALPGKYQYDSPGRLGVAGKYDPANQHITQRTLGSNNMLVTAGSRWRIARMVATNVHGDHVQGTWAAGSYYNHVHIEHGRDVAAPAAGNSQARNGIAGTQPKVQPGPHGDIQQWYNLRAPVCTDCTFRTSAHSVFFSRLENNYASFSGATISRDTATGSALVTVTGGHGMNTGDLGLVKTAGDGALNREWTVTKVSSTVVLLQGSTYVSGGSATLVATVHMYLNLYRCDLHTAKRVDTTDALSPVSSKGNVSISMQVTGLTRGSPSVAINNTISGELDYLAVVHDCRIETAGTAGGTGNGTWLMAPPVHSTDNDLGATNRNAWINWGAPLAVPGGTASPSLV